MLVCVRHYTLKFTGHGRLLPWIGPALRGFVARRFRDKVCRIPAPDRPAHCRRCAHMIGCPYGQTFEPDPPPDRAPTPGRESMIRPLVLAPYYPLPPSAVPGLAVPLRLVSIGDPASRHLSDLINALGQSGRSSGLGHDLIGFLLDADTTAAGQGPTYLSAADLPPTPDAIPGRAARVSVGLTSPLFLRNQPGENLRHPAYPQFADLLRAALRTIGELFRLYAEPLPADFQALKEAAEGVERREHCFEPFVQEHKSSRSGRTYLLRGVVGGGVYANVRWALIPWLVWGGRLHAGTNRLWGAGGWRVMLD